MPARSALALAAALALSACAATAPDSHAGHSAAEHAAHEHAAGHAGHAAPTADATFEQTVRPILVARNALAPRETAAPGNPAEYTYERVLMAGPSGFVVPFDAAGSLILRLAEDLPASAPTPLPNLRRLTDAERAAVRAWIEAGARGPDGRPGFSDTRSLIFACLQGENTVDLIDAETLRIVRRVRLAEHGLESRPNGPHHVAFEPDGSAWYTSVVSAGRVLKLSTRMDLDPGDPAYLLGQARMDSPGMLVVDPTTRRLYAGRSTLSPATTTGFAVVDRTTMAVETVATPFNVPHALALSPDGRYLLTAALTGGQAAVYHTATGDLSIHEVPGGPHELIHFSFVGAHAGHGGHGSAPPADAAEPPADAADDGHAHGTAHPVSGAYEATLTSRSTDRVLFFALAEDGGLTLTGEVAAGRGPWHAHGAADGRTLLVPNREGQTVTLIDAVERRVIKTIEGAAPGGPLSQPHSPVPGPGGRFFVSSSNLTGTWVPPFAFLGPPGPDGTRSPLPANRFGNLAVFEADGTLAEVIQLGAYPSGVEPFSMGGGHAH